MRLLRLMFAVGFAALPLAGAQADPAPFGLHWGDSPDFLSGRGLTMQEERRNGDLALYAVQGLRTVPADTAELRVVLARKDGLQRVIWLSKDVDTEPTGRKGVAAYEARKAALSENLGEPSSHTEESGVVEYTRPDQFYKCLATDGCGNFVTRWRTDEGDVYLRLIANRDANGGDLQVIYDGPEWDRLNGKGH